MASFKVLSDDQQKARDKWHEALKKAPPVAEETAPAPPVNHPEHHWKPNATLDRIVGKDRDPAIKHQVVDALKRRDHLLELGLFTPEGLNRKAASELAKLLPDLAPEKISRLLQHKGRELEAP